MIGKGYWDGFEVDGKGFSLIVAGLLALLLLVGTIGDIMTREPSCQCGDKCPCRQKECSDPGCPGGGR